MEDGARTFPMDFQLQNVQRHPPPPKELGYTHEIVNRLKLPVSEFYTKMINKVQRIVRETRPGKPQISITEALQDPLLLGAALGDTGTWTTWFTILKAIFGEHLDDDELEVFKSLAGSRDPPSKPVSEIFVIAGRRSGKSKMAASIVTFIACFVDHRSRLSKGETGFVLSLSPTMSQAKLVLDYCKAFIEGSPFLAEKIKGITATEIRLANNITISCIPSSFRHVRGRSILAVSLDECAYFRDEGSANPDVECYRALLPALATTKGVMIGISSPYRRAGLLYSKHKTSFGVNDPQVLVIQGSTEVFNPTIDSAVIERARIADSAAASSEWDANWRDDVSSYISRDLVERCVSVGLAQRPPAGHQCFAFCDPAGGAGADSMTMAIGHFDKARDVVVVDCLREVAPIFSPEAVVGEFAAFLKMYDVNKVTGDRFAGEWPREQFGKYQISYDPNAKPKSELYINLLPLLTSGRIELVDNPRLINQISNLERTASRSGRDTIDHPPGVGAGAHDDLANSVAGLASVCMDPYSNFDPFYGCGRPDTEESAKEEARQWRVNSLLNHIARYG